VIVGADAAAVPVAASPHISVIVPSYNSGPFLRQALMSALDQNPPPYEVLVQDGGSTDDTLDILRSFGQRVAWVSQPDGGQADAINMALARASGDLVLLLNADDVILPGSLAAATAAFEQHSGLAFAYGDFDMIDGAGALVRRYRSSEYSWDRVYSRGCYIFIGSLFVRREVLAEIGGYDASLRACMDFDLLLRLDAAGRSTHLRRTIGQFRMHSASKSSTIGLVFLVEAFRVRRRYARRSLRLWLVAVWSMPFFTVMLMTSRLRYLPRWPRHGRGKTL
jgi:glycosyltransferase involved in cell wall biosynthesis